MSVKKETDRILAIHDTKKVVTDILYNWTLGEIERFKVWMQENKDSENKPWLNL